MALNYRITKNEQVAFLPLIMLGFYLSFFCCVCFQRKKKSPSCIPYHLWIKCTPEEYLNKMKIFPLQICKDLGTILLSLS